MSEDPAIYTRTMAKIFYQQGHYDRAIKIYHHLLKQNPKQPDIVLALEEAEQRQQQLKSTVRELSLLVSEWIELLHKYRLIKKLNRLWNNKEVRGQEIDEHY